MNTQTSQTGQSHQNPRAVVADIGGTNARFALIQENQSLSEVIVLACADYPDIETALREYVRRIGMTSFPPVLIAIANPVQGDVIKMTNHHWSFSIQNLHQQLQAPSLRVINDFTALAYALPHLQTEDMLKIGGGKALANETCGLIGAGTGLGVSGIIPTEKFWVALNSEGGHVSFAPSSELEIEILRWAWKQIGHISAERLISGPGLTWIHRALAHIEGVGRAEHSASEITQFAREKSCPTCVHAVHVFSGMLGGAAGNLAVTLGSRGGVFLGGGVVGKLLDSFDQVLFRQRFEAKGRFQVYLQNIPTFLITHPYPTFLGLRALLN